MAIELAVVASERDSDAGYTQVKLSVSGALCANFFRGPDSAMGDQENAWGIGKIFCGDVSIGKCGRALETGRYYASASIIGGCESYHSIDVSPVQLSVPRGSTMPYRRRRETSRSAKFPMPRGSRVEFKTQEKTHREKQKAVLRKVILFCHQHPGVAVESAVPGAQDGNAGLATYFLRSCGPVRMQNKDGSCGPAAIINGVDCL